MSGPLSPLLHLIDDDEAVRTSLSLLAIGAAVICTLALARYHRANERKLIAECELLELEIQREKDRKD